MIFNTRGSKRRACLLIVLSVCILSFASISSSAQTDDLSFGLILRSLDIEFFQRINQGVQSACEERGIDLTTQYYENDASRAAQIAETFIAQGKDGIIFGPLEETSAMVVIDKAREANIPIVLVDNPPHSGMIGSQLSSVCSESYRGGFTAGARMVELLGGQGKVARQTFTFKVDVIDQRDQGFLDAISNSDLELVETVATDGTRSDTMDKVRGIFSKYPDLKGFFCCQGDAATGVAAIAKTAGKKDLIIAAYDVTESLKPFIREGTIIGVDQFPDEMGRRAVAYIINHLEGEYVPYITLIPVLEVNAQNVDEHKNYKDFLYKYGNGFIPTDHE